VIAPIASGSRPWRSPRRNYREIFDAGRLSSGRRYTSQLRDQAIAISSNAWQPVDESQVCASKLDKHKAPVRCALMQNMNSQGQTQGYGTRPTISQVLAPAARIGSRSPHPAVKRERKYSQTACRTISGTSADDERSTASPNRTRIRLLHSGSGADAHISNLLGTIRPTRCLCFGACNGACPQLSACRA
jgi:hypothetical protein